MANPHKGEIEIRDGNRVFTFCLSMNAICSLEEITGRGIFEIAEELRSWATPVEMIDGNTLVPKPESADQAKARMARVRVSFLRDILLAGLRENHPDATQAEAAGLIVALGGTLGAFGVVSEGIAAAFPAPQSAESPPNPRRRQRAG